MFDVFNRLSVFMSLGFVIVGCIFIMFGISQRYPSYKSNAFSCVLGFAFFIVGLVL